jgi:hypothetical protein
MAKDSILVHEQQEARGKEYHFRAQRCTDTFSVLYPGKGVCADPVNGSAILGEGRPNPHSRDREHQLAPDRGGGKT